MSDPGWQLLGGNPAPGSIEAVNAAVAGFAKVAKLVDEVIEGLGRSGGQHSIESWTGSAAQEFRSTLDTLPRHLRLVSTSYTQASAALRRYQDVLLSQQQTAVGVRSAALTAQSRLRREERLAGEASGRVTELNRRLVAAEAAATRAKRALAQASDPASRASAQSVLATALAHAARVRGDLRTAEADLAQHRRNAAAASHDLASQRHRADAVRAELLAAADRAIRALAAAEKDAQLPSWLTRTTTDTIEWLETNASVFADSFRLGATLFTIAATVFPPGAMVFRPCALALGAASLLIEAAIMADTPEGLSPDNLLKLGSEAMSLAALAVPGAGTIARIALQGGSSGLSAIRTVRRDGAIEGMKEFTGDVAFMLGGAVAGKAIQGTISQANRNPKVAEFIATQSGKLTRDIKRTSIARFSLGDDVARTGWWAEGIRDGTRVSRSVISSGGLGGGQFLVGNKAASPVGTVHGADHMLSRSALNAEVLEGGSELGGSLDDLIERRASSGDSGEDDPIELTLAPTSGSRLEGDSR